MLQVTNRPDPSPRVPDCVPQVPVSETTVRNMRRTNQVPATWIESDCEIRLSRRGDHGPTGP
jgi:hypothetical protein